MPAGVLFPHRNRRESILRTAERCKLPLPKDLDAMTKRRLLFNLALKIQYDRVMARRARAAQARSEAQTRLNQTGICQTTETQKKRLQQDTPKPTHSSESGNTSHGAPVPARSEFPSCYKKTLMAGVDYMMPRNQNDAHMLAVALHEELRHGKKALACRK
jgi:hypothetical protein